jgi:hypothetical protein
MSPLICCPRCAHQNPTQARFCASCGLNLAAAGASIADYVGRTTARSRRWLIIILMLLLLVLGAFVLSIRL